MPILLYLASLPANLDQCVAAVRTSPATAAAACEGPKEINPFSADGPDPRCLQALAAGKEVGKYATALPMVRKAMSDKFEKMLATCKNPPVSKPIPEQKTVNLWD